MFTNTSLYLSNGWLLLAFARFDVIFCWQVISRTAPLICSLSNLSHLIWRVLLWGRLIPLRTQFATLGSTSQARFKQVECGGVWGIHVARGEHVDGDKRQKKVAVGGFNKVIKGTQGFGIAMQKRVWMHGFHLFFSKANKKKKKPYLVHSLMHAHTLELQTSFSPNYFKPGFHYRLWHTSPKACDKV